MRVAFLSEHASPVALLGGADAGGQNVYVDQVGRHLGALGHEVDVFTRRDRADLPPVMAWAPGVRVVNLAAGPARFVPKDDLWPLMPAFRDAARAFMVASGVRYDLIHGNFWLSGWVAAELGRELNLPVVQIFHATGKTKRRCQGAADTSPAARIGVELEIVRRADRLIAQCPSERDELIGDYAADPDRIALIPSGVDAELFRPVARAEAWRRLGLVRELPTATPVVAYVGRLLPRKDVRNVVQALALLCADWPREPRPLLLVVGGESDEPDPVATPELGEIRRLAADLGIADRVRCIGRRQRDVLRYCYGAGDVVVTTPWYEPFGLTPLEGMACGRPVIGSAVGGIAFTIIDGVTGFLVPPRDPPALADRLARLLSDAALRERMGRAARARVEAEFTWATVGRRTAALYADLLRSDRPLAPREEPAVLAAPGSPLATGYRLLATGY